jgi:hypothetical protein
MREMLPNQPVLLISVLSARTLCFPADLKAEEATDYDITNVASE